MRKGLSAMLCCGLCAGCEYYSYHPSLSVWGGLSLSNCKAIAIRWRVISRCQETHLFNETNIQQCGALFANLTSSQVLRQEFAYLFIILFSIRRLVGLAKTVCVRACIFLTV